MQISMGYQFTCVGPERCSMLGISEKQLAAAASGSLKDLAQPSIGTIPAAFIECVPCCCSEPTSLCLHKVHATLLCSKGAA